MLNELVWSMIQLKDSRRYGALGPATFMSSSKGLGHTELKAELHPKDEVPLVCILPPSTATFGTF